VAGRPGGHRPRRRRRRPAPAAAGAGRPGPRGGHAQRLPLRGVPGARREAGRLPARLDDARLAYTLDLARILGDLLPDDAARGSVSTLPLGWREPWDAGRARACRRNLDDLARGLHALPRPVRVAFEPEPGCVIENTAQAAALLAGVDTAVLGVCLDLAHLACAWEEPAAALRRLADAGLPVVKTQISAALGSTDPRRDAAVLGEYVEPRFLHQTRSRSGLSTDDLDQALATAGGDGQPWRVHYHVPLHAPPIPPLSSTVDVLADALKELLGADRAGCDHLDVETYTWHVLPPASRPSGPDELAAGIAAELRFARAQLTALGLAVSHEVAS
jgi:xylose isomerase-like TIM barrel protein